jgi:hypothetical protein
LTCWEGSGKGEQRGRRGWSWRREEEEEEEEEEDPSSSTTTTSLED